MRYYGPGNPYGENSLEAMDSHGGWIASATDLLRFLAGVDGDDATPDLLDNDSRSVMGAKDHSLWPGSGGYYALGWSRYEGQWSHAGSLPGTLAYMEMRDDGLNYAALTNIRPDANGFDFSGTVESWINAVNEWPDHDLWPQFSSR